MRFPVAILTVIAALVTWFLLLFNYFVLVYPNVKNLSLESFMDWALALIFAALMALTIIFGIWYAVFSILHKVLTSTDTFKHLK